MLHLFDYFDKELMFLDFECDNQINFFGKMYKILEKRGDVKDSFLNSIIEREKEFPTGLDLGKYKIAIPHTNSEHVNAEKIIFIRNKEKIIFKAKDLPEASNECTTCESCVTVCPTHIDIRKGLQLECINCLECVDACTTVMGKLGKPSLVQWSSTNAIKNDIPTKMLRKSTIMYSVALLLVVALLFVMGGEKEYMLLNINKTTQLYKVKEDNVVANNYVLLFQNTESKPLTYNLEITDNPDIKITRFEPFTLSPGKLAKKVVILETDKVLVNDKSKDTPITVTLKAYAQEDPEKVVVFRKAVFIYPRADKLK